MVWFAMKRGLGVLALFLVAGVGVYVWAMLTAAAEIRRRAGDAEVEQTVAGVTMLSVKRVGQVSTLSPGPGTGLALVMIPLLAGLVVFTLTFVRARRM